MPRGFSALEHMTEPPKPEASKVLTVDERVGLDRFEFDEEPFITVETDICRTCDTKPCLYVCPSKVYRVEKGELVYKVLGSLDDDPRQTEPVGEGLELDALHANRQCHADLLAPLRADLVRLHFLAAVRRGAHEISREHQIVEVPEIVRVFHPDLDFSRFRVAVEHPHRSWPWRRTLLGISIGARSQ